MNVSPVLCKESADAVNRVFNTIDTYAELLGNSIGPEGNNTCVSSKNIGLFPCQKEKK